MEGALDLLYICSQPVATLTKYIVVKIILTFLINSISIRNVESILAFLNKLDNLNLISCQRAEICLYQTRGRMFFFNLK